MIGPYFAIRLGTDSPGVAADEFFKPPHLRSLVDDVAHRLGTD